MYRMKTSTCLFALGNVRRPCRMLVALMSLRASCHDGFGHGRSGSSVTGSTWRWNSNRTQSMIRMMRCGGFASFRTARPYTIQQYIHTIHYTYNTIHTYNTVHTMHIPRKTYAYFGLSLWLIGTVRAEPETVISRAWVQSPDPAE